MHVSADPTRDLPQVHDRTVRIRGGRFGLEGRPAHDVRDVTLRLDGQRAPRSVASFIVLARAGYWTDSVCHRLTTPPAPTAFLQCGDPSGRSTAEPGYDLPLENVPADQTYRVGDVGMARGDGFPGTAGEFFVVHRDFTVVRGHPSTPSSGTSTRGWTSCNTSSAGR